MYQFAIVGLGNPGPEYKNTRHNAGYLSLEAFQKSHNFPDFEIKKSLFCMISHGEINGKKIILALPQTYMNNSGQAVKKLVENYFPRQKKTFENLIVVHDDAYLSLGRIKISKNRGGGGHKGIASIVENLKTKNFTRVRIGVGIKPKDIVLKDFVLQEFSPQEQAVLKRSLKTVNKILETIISENLNKAMQRFNQKISLM